MLFSVQTNQNFLGKSIDELELSVRSNNCLKRAKYMTIGDVIDNWASLDKIYSCGKNSVKEIKSAIFNYNIQTMEDNQLKNWIKDFSRLNK